MVGVMGDMADTMEQIGPLFVEKPFWKVGLGRLQYMVFEC